jgi:16S rRNA pseudouridine516 synthase
MQLQQILFSQGFGSRRECDGLIFSGQVRVALAGPEGEVLQACVRPESEFEAEALSFEVQGQRWTYQELAYVLLHKPAGHECSQKPGAWPSVYSLLPAPLRMRPRKGSAPGVQAVGRLDQDTTGLLLLSDDGQFIHRMSSPRHHVPKVYEVWTAQDISAAQVQRLLQGLELRDGPHPEHVRARDCVQVDAQHLRLTLEEGKYHQVKRMLAAVGNAVVRLHRSSLGGLVLPADLAPGQWRWLGRQDLSAAGLLPAAP